MTKETKRIMAAFRRKLGRVLDLESSACGHEGPVAIAARARIDLEFWLQGELDRLQQSVGGGQ